MALVQKWLPPTKESWEMAVWVFQWFPLVTILQWFLTWYPAGKTSTNSRFNIPGRIAWITMEIPGVLVLSYIMYSLPSEIGLGGFSALPWENKAMGGLFVIHYLYRAIISPSLNPSMSPIHPIVWASAIAFQLMNGLSIGGYLGGHGPTTHWDWQGREMNYKAGGRMELGMMIFFLGFFANMFHDDELREIRRAAQRNMDKKLKEAGEQGKSKRNVDKVYMIPKNGLFWYIFFPHYLCEWIEWGGYWMMAGLGATPMRNFLVNEIATMLPRAVAGRRWYIERFGREKIEGRKAVIPGIL
ncbi:steroid 5 alpha-reductase [Amylocarpus encephaloides]|uniref:Steroid 5 alpha-reductase n=1 Tax=Amylocarpus encephaloides TaxID=45428 RepID=A0A9P7YTD5_9HELO|nr:steroid 5 alpha-reductase [Amylocarpus encephaloides]